MILFFNPFFHFKCSCLLGFDEECLREVKRRDAKVIILLIKFGRIYFIIVKKSERGNLAKK